MNAKNAELAKVDEEIIADQLIRLFTFLQENPGISKRSACEELGISYRAALNWIAEGRLASYLESIHDVRSDVSQILALNNLPGIVTYQARIARGEVSPPGSNPTAAAQFVKEIAQLGARESERQRQGPQVNVFIPEIIREEVVDIEPQK